MSQDLSYYQVLRFLYHLQTSSQLTFDNRVEPLSWCFVLGFPTINDLIASMRKELSAVGTHLPDQHGTHITFCVMVGMGIEGASFGSEVSTWRSGMRKA
jgi:hypothetical protein